MKVALIGATGYVGSEVLAELLARGHQVTALVRHPEKLAQHTGLTTKKVDVLAVGELSEQLKNHDAVISAHSGFASGVPEVIAYDQHLQATVNIFEAVRNARVNRLLVVGGAGSLRVAPNVDLVDTPEFPEQWKTMALAARAALNIARNESEINWTFISPSAHLMPGQKTGKYRSGLDDLLIGANGQSEITVPDFALALVDELESPKHSKVRFTVGY